MEQRSAIRLLYQFRLPLEQQQNPSKVFDCFFDAYTLPAAKQKLMDCMQTALTSDNDQYDTALSRAQLLSFCQFVEELFEAAYFFQLDNN